MPRAGRRAPPAAAVRRRATSPGALGRPAVQLRPRPSWPGARAAAGPQAAPPPFLPRPAAPVAAPGRPSSSTTWSRFVEHPVKGFLRQRRRAVAVPREDEEPADALPVELDGLASGRSATGCCATGSPGSDARPVPAGRVAARRPAAGRAGRRAARRRARGRRAAGGGGRRGTGRRRPPTRVDVGARAARRTRVVAARSAGCHGDDTALRVEYSRLAPEAPAAAWVRLLALTAADRPSRGGRSRSAAGERLGIAQARSSGRSRRTRPGRCSPSWWRCATRAARAAAAAHRDRRTPTPGSGAAERRAADALAEAAPDVDGRRGRRARRPAHERVWGAGRTRVGAAPATGAGRRAASPPGSARSPGGCGHRCCRPRTWYADDLHVTRARRVRRLRAAADRHHRAGGQRRHRQDVHDRRARRPLRRRGRGRRCPS